MERARLFGISHGSTGDKSTVNHATIAAWFAARQQQCSKLSAAHTAVKQPLLKGNDVAAVSGGSARQEPITANKSTHDAVQQIVTANAPVRGDLMRSTEDYANSLSNALQEAIATPTDLNLGAVNAIIERAVDAKYEFSQPLLKLLVTACHTHGILVNCFVRETILVQGGDENRRGVVESQEVMYQAHDGAKPIRLGEIDLPHKTA